MSTIVFAEMPAFGHVNPSLPVVQELVRRGERVIYYNAEEFRPHVERAGATFRPYPAGVLGSADIAAATQSGNMTEVVGVILRATESLLPFLLADLPQWRPDAIAYDSNALWGRMAATKLGLPTISLLTTFMLSSAQLRLFTAREWVHSLRPVLPSLPGLIAVRSRVIRRFGKSLYPPPPTLPMRGGTNIMFIPRELQPDHPLIDETFHFVGPTVNPEAQPADFPFGAVGPEPIVYISLGTLHLGSADFFRQCFAAFADLPARFILSAGQQTDIGALGTIPANFVVRPAVPQLAVLRQAAVFITHGGMNSALEGLYYGVPLIVIPQQVEQLLIGLHVASRGAGLVLREHVAGKRVVARQLRQSLERVLGDPRYRAAAGALQASLRASGGYRAAADEIQAYIARVGSVG